MKPAKVELYIEELVLHGFAPGDRFRIGEAMERELTRLLAEQGLPSRLTQGGEIAQLEGGVFEAVPNSRPERSGEQIARAVYGGLNK